MINLSKTEDMVHGGMNYTVPGISTEKQFGIVVLLL